MTHLSDKRGFESTRVTHVRTATKVNEGTAAVYGGGGCGYLLVQNPELELVILEERRRGEKGGGQKEKIKKNET